MRRESRRVRGIRGGARRGGILIEFALVVLIGYIFFAGVITYARLFFGGQVVQNAVDIMARETSRHPLPGNLTFEALLTLDPNDGGTPASVTTFQQEVYGEQWLVVDISQWINGAGPCAGGSLAEFLDCSGMPIVNQALLPLMFREGTTLRYPGAIVGHPEDVGGIAGGDTVLVPIVTARAGDGTETIEWSRVVEEVETPASADPFQLLSPEGGMVQVRVNYPYQAGAMVSFQVQTLASTSPDLYPGGTGEFAWHIRNQANDAGVAVGALPPGYGPPGGSFAESETPSRVYGGPYGLGALNAFPDPLESKVRPFRRVMTAQSFHRREVFE